MPVEPGEKVIGKVVRLADYGVFIEVAEQEVGLAHISEIAHTFVKDVSDYFEVGDEVMVKVLGRNEKGKLELSIKQVGDEQLEEVKERIARLAGPENIFRRRPPQSFEEKLSRFMKFSEERQSAARKQREARRRG